MPDTLPDQERRTLASLHSFRKGLEYAPLLLRKDGQDVRQAMWEPIPETVLTYPSEADELRLVLPEKWESDLVVVRCACGTETPAVSEFDGQTIALQVRSHFDSKGVELAAAVYIGAWVYLMVSTGSVIKPEDRANRSRALCRHLSEAINVEAEPFLGKIPVYGKGRWCTIFVPGLRRTKEGAFSALVDGDVKALVKATVKEAVAKMPNRTYAQVQSALEAEEITQAAAEAAPLSIMQETDALYSREILAIRNRLVLDGYDKPKRRYGLATAAMLAGARAIAGKRLIVKTAEVGTVYCGTGVMVLAGESGKGKSFALTRARDLYRIITGVDPFEAQKPTLPSLIRAISTMRYGGERFKCETDPRGFLWVAEEFSSSFSYLIADFSGSGASDEGRFNCLFDSGSNAANNSLRSPMATYDNCNMMLAAVQPVNYACYFQPFSETKVASGLTARLGIVFQVDQIPTWDTETAYDGVAEFDAAMDRLQALSETVGYYRCVAPEGLTDRFTAIVGDLTEREPELVRSAAPKRVREALAEAALMVYLRGDKPQEPDAAKEGGKWASFSAPHSHLKCVGTLTLDEETINNRLAAQAVQFVNHYLITSYMGADDTYAARIKRTLTGAPTGLRSEQLIRLVDSSGRNYRAVREAIDSLITQGEVYVVTRKTGTRGRPEKRIVHRDFVTKADANKESK